MLVGVTEGMLPFKLDDDDGKQQKVSDDTAARLQEERRLMYVGITRAQRTLAVSWTKRRKKGREMVPASPAASSRKWAWTRPPPRKTRAKSCASCARNLPRAPPCSNRRHDTAL
jgi:superfamily I DNA/RNA helicase